MLFTNFSCENRKTGESKYWTCRDTKLVKDTINSYTAVVYQFAMMAGTENFKDIRDMIYDVSVCKNMDDIEALLGKYDFEVPLTVFKWVCRRVRGLSIKTCFQTFMISMFWSEMANYIADSLDDCSEDEFNPASLFIDTVRSFVVENYFEHTGYHAVCNLIIGTALRMMKVRVGLAGVAKKLITSYKEAKGDSFVEEDGLTWLTKDGYKFTIQDLYRYGLATFGVDNNYSLVSLFVEVQTGLDEFDSVCSLSDEQLSTISNTERFSEYRYLLVETLTGTPYVVESDSKEAIRNPSCLLGLISTVLNIDEAMF